ncbi:MAG: hypothetical protein EP340_02130 [Alphaproteobacteria bacterium]|nr:MAG: hypothetical protein EP340_02130 [Alphaproteobacteria bacterium]
MKLSALLLNDTSLAGNHGSTLATRQIMRFCEEAGIEVARRYRGDVDLSKIDRRGIDLVLVNGEGSLHSSSKAALGMASVPGWAKGHDLPCFLINSIYQNNSSAVLEGVSGYDAIYLRDPLSADELAREGGHPSGVVDIAMTWGPVQTAAQGPRVIVTDASGKADNKALYEFSSLDGGRYFLPFRAQVPHGPSVPEARFSRRLKFSVRHGLARFQKPSLEQARYGHAIADFEGFTEFLRREAGFMVTGRYHGVCLAAALCIPFVALASESHKTKSLLAALGLSGRGLSREALLAADTQALSPFRTFSDTEMKSIEEFVNEQQLEAHKMFSAIAEQASGKGPRSDP